MTVVHLVFAGDIEQVSVAVALVSIATYAAGLFFSLRTHRGLFNHRARPGPARLCTASRDRCAEDRFPGAAPARRRSQLDPARSRTSGQDRAAARHAARPAPLRPRHGRRTHQPADVRQSSLAGQSAHAGAPAVALRSSRSSRVTDRDLSETVNGFPRSALRAAPRSDTPRRAPRVPLPDRCSQARTPRRGCVGPRPE